MAPTGRCITVAAPPVTTCSRAPPLDLPTWGSLPCRLVLETEPQVVASRVSMRGADGETPAVEQVREGGRPFGALREAAACRRQLAAVRITSHVGGPTPLTHPVCRRDHPHRRRSPKRLPARASRSRARCSSERGDSAAAAVAAARWCGSLLLERFSACHQRCRARSRWCSSKHGFSRGGTRWRCAGSRQLSAPSPALLSTFFDPLGPLYV